MTLHPPNPNAFHDETKCSWKLISRGSTNTRSVDTYQCQHGWTSEGHPRGWCDQGCCR